ncbi:MAG: peptide chain release factor N(5)-glutamine methyltransferase [Myxococcales bacterium]
MAPAVPSPGPSPAAGEGPSTWTIQRVLRWTAEHFAAKGKDSPRLTGEVLLAHALGTTRLQLYLQFDRPLEAAELDRFRELVRRRAAGEPTQHLVGGREIHGRWFAVDRRAFIPRPETELLIDACLTALGPPGNGGGEALLDLCAGSGCVGLSLLAERPAARVTAVELSPEAAQVARANAASLALEERYELLTGDLFGPLGDRGGFGLIAANPPYVATGEIETLAVEVRDHDPRLALDGGPDGLAVIRRIVREGAPRLAPGGTMALEIGEEQGERVRALMQEAGLTEVAVIRDHARLDRVAIGRRPAG